MDYHGRRVGGALRFYFFCEGSSSVLHFKLEHCIVNQNSKEVSKGALQIMLSRSVQVAGLDLFVSSRAASLRCQKYCARSPSNLKVSNPMHITQHGRWWNNRLCRKCGSRRKRRKWSRDLAFLFEASTVLPPGMAFSVLGLPPRNHQKPKQMSINL